MGSRKPDPHFGNGASPGKIFIGGLAKDATLDQFTKYFGKYGEITDSVIMKERDTGRPRGFGFVTYADPSVVDTVIAETHIINGKQVEIKRTIPKGASESKDFKTKKIFVGGIPTSVTEDEFKNFFSKYGKVVEQEIIRDHVTNRSRGFGFVIFDNEQVVDDILVNGNMIEMGGSKMDVCTMRCVIIVTLSFMWIVRGAIGIRLVIDREECFTHDVEYVGDAIHISFVVIKTDTAWHYGDEGVDLMIKGPSGESIYELYDKVSERYDFAAAHKGPHRFCFRNKSPYQETIDFDLHVGHFGHLDQHAKDEHFNPLLEQISKLEEALYNIQFEQHWLEAQRDRQAIVNEVMSRRAVQKAIFESAALIGASVLQVYLLQRLFDQKLRTSRV